MTYDEGVATRLRELFHDRDDIVEKRMFGGLAFLLSGNMLCGVSGELLIARVGPNRYAQALDHPHAREMDFTGRPLRGFVYVVPEGFESDNDLEEWVQTCEAFVGTLPPK